MRSTVLAGLAALLLGASIEAQPCMAPPLSLNTRPGLIGGPCTAQAPAPNPRTNGNACQCVVALTTTERRVVAREGLYQECPGHYGHGRCPASSTNCDSGHTAPYGNWGVRVRNSTLASALASETISSQSREEDCSQWPGTRAGSCGPAFSRRPCAQWHTCNCDTRLDFGNNPPPAFVSSGAAALAGFYVINSASAECGALNGQPSNIRSLLEIYELDSDFSDLIDSLFVDLPVTLSCTGPNLCQGEATRTVRGQMQRLEADFRVRVRCASSLPPPPPPGGGGGEGGCVDTPGGRCGACGCRGGCAAGLTCLADGLCHGTRSTEGGLVLEECSAGSL